MRQSQLFTKTRKEAPADEVSKNAQLLIRGGFIHKEMAGVYSYLPLGLRVLRKVEQIIREEMDLIGGEEVYMPALQLKERYEQTGRWSDDVVDNWFKTQLANGTELGLGFSHEENLVPLVKNYVQSYKDLPVAPYQIQTKFRNELRSKSGLMRGREFLMKDMYSFCLTEEQHNAFYEAAQSAYHRIYDRLGLGANTFLTFASGGSFSKFSHEFQTLSDAGEDTIYLDRGKRLAVNKEVYTDDVLAELGLDKANLEEVRAIEVGNIFHLKTKFSAPFDLTVVDQDGKTQPVLMGCYGIGVSRVMGTIAEVMSDEQGLVWPENIAPFDVHLVSLCREEADVAAAEKLYGQLIEDGYEVLYDDRDARAGEKFSDSDLIGIPVRIVVSPKTLEQGSVEVKRRTEADAVMQSLDKIEI